jgi:alpha-L-rhamnosidase
LLQHNKNAYVGSDFDDGGVCGAGAHRQNIGIVFTAPGIGYMLANGATTIWERWDALDENGVCTIGDDGTGGMISFNHYAFGAVGDFLYRRIAGIEAETGGYQTFRIQPIVGEGIDFAKGEVNTPFGKVCSEWKTKNETFTLQISVPVSTTCRVVMPSGQEYLVGSGKYSYCESLKKERKRYENGK